MCYYNYPHFRDIFECDSVTCSDGLLAARSGEPTIPVGLCASYRSVHTLQWRHNGRGGVSNHQRHDWLLNRLFRRRSKKTPKLRVTGFCAENSPVTGSNTENVSIWWRHHDNFSKCLWLFCMWIAVLFSHIYILLQNFLPFSHFNKSAQRIWSWWQT